MMPSRRPIETSRTVPVRTIDLTASNRDHQGMDQADVERLEAAVAALNDGDLDPFVGLIDDDMVWTGQPQGWLWWRHTPS